MGKNKSQARKKAEEERLRLIEERRAGQRQGVLSNLGLVAVLVVLYFVRGGQFEGLGQLLALAMSFFLAQLVMDVTYLVKDRPSPEGWKAKYLPVVGLAAAIFLVLFLVLG